MLTGIMVLMIVFSNAAGDVFITKGMKQIGDLSAISLADLLSTIRRILTNLNFWLGVACLAVSFFSFITVLSWADLSFVVPATAIVYVVTVFGAKFILKEQIDALRWAGTILVCLGVGLVCVPDEYSISLADGADLLRTSAGALAACSVGYYLVSLFAAEKFFSKPRPPAPSQLPPVSILIPLSGADFRAYENYLSLCGQDYPEFQIVFGVRDMSDSSVEVVDKLRSEFPEKIELVCCDQVIGPNPKVNSLNGMLRRARHEIILLLDSDIRVKQDFLKSIVSELPPGGEGLVTCLYRAGEAPGVPSTLEAIGISTEFAPGVLVAEFGAGISFAFGAAIATSKKTIEAIGGFSAIAPYLADDYMLGNLARKAGFPVKLSRVVVETVLSRMTFQGFFTHQVRWARGIRACAPWGHAGSIITNGTLFALLYSALSGFSSSSALVFAFILALRISAAWLIGVRRLGDSVLRKNLWLVPARDLLSFVIWLWALFGKSVEWRGRLFILEEKGKMRPPDQ